MSESRTRIKRQIELLGLILTEPCRYKILDLECYFDCTQITIKRDLKDLRSYGIDVHSVPGKGIRVENEIPQDILNELLAQYIITTGIDTFYHRSLHFFTGKFKELSVSHFTQIQTAIEQNRMLDIDYLKRPDQCEKKTIAPLLLFLNENEWRLLAFNEEKIKQFLLSKINSIRLLEKTYPDNLKKEAQKSYNSSFGNWIGGESYEVKLKFTKDWLHTGKEPKMMEMQNTREEKDGSKIVCFSVNSLEEVARWVAGRAGDVRVVEPAELRKMVTDIAQNVLEANGC